MRQGQRFKARLNERPSGQIHCSRLLQQNRPKADSIEAASEVGSFTWTPQSNVGCAKRIGTIMR